MKLLNTMVNEKSKSICTTSTKTLKGTDHRVSSQKSALEEEYGIRFPVKRARVSESSKQVVLTEQEKDASHACSFLHGSWRDCSF